MCVRVSVRTYDYVIAIVGQSSFNKSVALICVRDGTTHPSLAIYLWPRGLRVSRCSSTQRLKLVLLSVASQRHFSIHTVSAYTFFDLSKNNFKCETNTSRSSFLFHKINYVYRTLPQIISAQTFEFRNCMLRGLSVSGTCARAQVRKKQGQVQ